MLVSNASFYAVLLIEPTNVFSYIYCKFLILQVKYYSLSVMCLLRVAHVNIYFVYFPRHNYLKKFAMGVNKPSRPDLAPIRCKEMFRLEELSQVLAKPRYCALLVLYNIVNSIISSLVPYPYYPFSLDSYLFSSVHP